MTETMITIGHGNTVGRYRLANLRKHVVLCLLLAAVVLVFLADIATGPAWYGLDDVLKTVLMPADAQPQMRVVIWSIRMPSALMAIVVGMALATAGVQMQTVLNNPLASPFTLGISSAASFGAALALAFGLSFIPVAGDYIVAVNAFIMALGSALIIHSVGLRRGSSVQTIVLLGIALVFSFNTALAMVQYFANDQAVAAIVFWTMGSLTKATWPKLAVTVAVLVLTIPIFVYRRWQLTALRLGEARAASFGIPVRRLRLETLVLISLLSSIPVAFVGTIGFVGLVAPHIARMLVGEDQRHLLPASAMIGALIMSSSSTVAKVLVPGAVLPIGVITAVIGLPVFFYLILRGGRETW
ncbi:iron ABC transporter permease [Rhizobium sp. BK377]|uniref:FecCD family ABC transporter permease n=1 Tax=Rhizobium sp. BK377 TaxID=2587058 RepID=UPI00182F2B2F|nr:iron ABC transporter permease [Rhizobium sp. BK377]MBB3462780.1 iron complex transport system permease protein [Rhizobium sp. BK377]